MQGVRFLNKRFVENFYKNGIDNQVTACYNYIKVRCSESAISRRRQERSKLYGTVRYDFSLGSAVFHGVGY